MSLLKSEIRACMFTLMDEYSFDELTSYYEKDSVRRELNINYYALLHSTELTEELVSELSLLSRKLTGNNHNLFIEVDIMGEFGGEVPFYSTESLPDYIEKGLMPEDSDIFFLQHDIENFYKMNDIFNKTLEFHSHLGKKVMIRILIL